MEEIIYHIFLSIWPKHGTMYGDFSRTQSLALIWKTKRIQESQMNTIQAHVIEIQKFLPFCI